MIDKCNLCENTKISFLFKNHDRMFNLSGDYDIFRCDKCGLIFINPQPADEELSKHYPNDYYSFNGEKPKEFAIKIYQKIYLGNLFEKLLFSPFKLIFRHTLVVPDGRFLDIGCGSGKFMVLMQKLGMECFGVETGKIDGEFVKKNNLKIYNTNLKDANFPDDYFDVISLSWVLEHIKNPLDVFHEIKRILKPNGKIILSVPQSKCLLFFIFGKYWASLDTPRHLFIFSKKTIKMYSEKTGLKIIKTKNMQSNILHTLFYFSNALVPKERFFSENNFSKNIFLQLLVMPISLMISAFRLGDEIEVILSKEK